MKKQENLYRNLSFADKKFDFLPSLTWNARKWNLSFSFHPTLCSYLLIQADSWGDLLTKGKTISRLKKTNWAALSTICTTRCCKKNSANQDTCLFVNAHNSFLSMQHVGLKFDPRREAIYWTISVIGFPRRKENISVFVDPELKSQNIWMSTLGFH